MLVALMIVVLHLDYGGFNGGDAKPWRPSGIPRDKLSTQMRLPPPE